MNGAHFSRLIRSLSSSRRGGRDSPAITIPTRYTRYLLSSSKTVAFAMPNPAN